jgi:hypothetical protein
VRVWWGLAATLVMLVSACGGSDGGGSTPASAQLSASAYKAHLQTVAKESDKAQHAVERGFRATSVSQLVAVLTAFGAAENRIGDQVGAFRPPTNAEAANRELAKGEHDTASEVQAILPKIKKMPSAQAAVAYLSKKPSSKGGREIDQALAKLKQLGYIKNVS